jgi:serralysin
MADYFFDSANLPPSPTTDTALAMQTGDTLYLSAGVSLRMMAAGKPAITMTGSNNSAIWGTVYSASGKGFEGGGNQQILIGASGVLRAQLNAIEIQAGGNIVRNAGSITSINGAGLLFSGGGSNSVTNSGMIVAAMGIEIGGTTAETDNLQVFNSGSIEVTGTAVKGTLGNDTITNTGTLRTTGATLIDLGGGHDIYDGFLGVAIGKIALGAGNDTAHGGAGSETFSGDLGDDYIDGGAGIDTADYSSSAFAAFIDLRLTSWQFTGQGQDLLLNIENITGTAQNDILTGSNGDNVLVGGAGNDLLEGGLGTDVLDGGAHAATEGGDTARYTGSAAAYVNLALTGTQNTIGYGYDTLIGIEHLEGGSGPIHLRATTRTTGSWAIAATILSPVARATTPSRVGQARTWPSFRAWRRTTPSPGPSIPMAP